MVHSYHATLIIIKTAIPTFGYDSLSLHGKESEQAKELQDQLE